MEVLTLVGDMWGDYTAGNLSRNITGFAVLSEPRAVTAKAALDRVRQVLPLGFDEPSTRLLTRISGEFGVES